MGINHLLSIISFIHISEKETGYAIFILARRFFALFYFGCFVYFTPTSYPRLFSLSLIQAYFGALPFFLLSQAGIMTYLLLRPHASTRIWQNTHPDKETENERREPIRNFVKNNQVQQAFDLLFLHVEDASEINMLILLHYRWKKNLVDQNKGIISSEEAKKESNKIVKAILEFVN